jgi:hypothetical protein
MSLPAQIKADVLIVGGGVIGLASAYELSRAGVKVVLIDKSDPGYGCSYGNAGWITPCFSMPLPMPGMLLKSIGWLTDPESPLYIKPELSWTLFRWLLRFLLSMNRKQMFASVSTRNLQPRPISLFLLSKKGFLWWPNRMTVLNMPVPKWSL